MTPALENARLIGGLVSLLLAGVSACGQRPSSEMQARAADTQATAVSPPDSLSALIGDLGDIKGGYRHGSSGQWVFDGARGLFAAIAGYGDSAVARLTDCLDNPQPSSTTLEGKPVPIGVVCYEALLYTAYAEPEGSDTGEWPGIVLPTATVEELRAAKAAWQQVVREKSYRLH